MNLTVKNVFLDEICIQFRSLKKRKFDKKGNPKLTQYRTVPVHERFVELLDLSFDLKRKMYSIEGKDSLLFNMHRQTAFRLIKRVMENAGISGCMAMPKGLRLIDIYNNYLIHYLLLAQSNHTIYRRNI